MGARHPSGSIRYAVRMEQIAFGLIGSGWRGDFFERIAAALPDRFRLTGRYSRRVPGSAASFDELLSGQPEFVVVAVPWEVTPLLTAELAERGIAVLAETPPAPDIAGLRALAALARYGGRIQVAEQYRFQPFHAARLAIAASGRLGAISQVQVSIAHGYHGINLIRRFLAVGSEPVTITARRVDSPVVGGPDRSGPPSSEQIVTQEQILATFDFGDRLGIFDFTYEQYFSWIRGLRLLVRGERGEIDGSAARWLDGDGRPVRLTIDRHDTGHNGNLEGLYLEGITLGAEWLYRNPFGTARLTDDEIAVASCLAGMPAAIDGGPAVCSLADAAQDHYLNLLMTQSIETGLPVRAAGHVWDAPAEDATYRPLGAMPGAAANR
jgi:predicted dehydrogenase